MKYLFILALILTSCKKESQITFKLEDGFGDVVITQGKLVTDFKDVGNGWELNRKAERNTRYTIECYSGKYNIVSISYNGKVVVRQQKFATFTTK